MQAHKTATNDMLAHISQRHWVNVIQCQTESQA